MALENKKLHLKISALVLTTVAVIASMAAILVHERERIREIEAESAEIRQVRRDINAAYRHITRLATLGESVIGWEEADSTRYRALRLRTDSLLQALKPHCRDYVRPAQIDTLRTLLAEKEAHLLHLTEILDRQNEADSLLVNHLPEVARRKADWQGRWAARKPCRCSPPPRNCTSSATACTQDELTDDTRLPEGQYPLQIAAVTLSVEGGEAQPWGAPQTRVSENGDGTGWQYVPGSGNEPMEGAFANVQTCGNGRKLRDTHTGFGQIL